jgi:hypothetical protein
MPEHLAYKTFAINRLRTVKSMASARTAVNPGVAGPSAEPVDSKPLPRLLARVKMICRTLPIVARDKIPPKLRGSIEFSQCRAPF